MLVSAKRRSDLRNLSILGLLISCNLIFQSLLIVAGSTLPSSADQIEVTNLLYDSFVQSNDYDVASSDNVTFAGNTTVVSVITATPEVSIVIATAVTTTISATTASVSISTTGEQRDFYLEAAIIIIIAAVLGAVVFGRSRRFGGSE